LIDRFHLMRFDLIRVSTTPGNLPELFVQDVEDRPHWFPVIKLGTRSLI